MLIELPVTEQRYLAVREVLDTGASIVEVARQYGVDRRTLHGWISRYVNGGFEASVASSIHRDSTSTSFGSSNGLDTTRNSPMPRATERR